MSSATSILITGASGGIGGASARLCASKGARVGVHYNGNQAKAEALIKSLPGDGHQLYQCDITDPDAVQQLIGQADRDFGGLDVLVNNAGVSERQAIDKIDYETWQKAWHRIVETNLTAAANLSFCASQKMIKNGGGRIINVSSRGAFRGEPMMP
ncbi:MAG: 3-oxoacyl-[acyl-carrier protein] reductase, partial [Gammaproteobacteria bacterium]